MYSFPRFAVVKYHKVGGFKQRKCPVSRLWRPEIWSWGAGPCSLGNAAQNVSCPPPACQGGMDPWLAPASLPSPSASSQGALLVSLSSCGFPSLWHHPIGLGPTLVTSSKLDYLCKDLISERGHIHRSQGAGLQHDLSQGHNSTLNTAFFSFLGGPMKTLPGTMLGL